MSLAPASSRGAFLKARLAVNGIQCAARSFGTLTAGGVGLLSSMGASLVFWGVAVAAQAISFVARTGTPRAADISAQSGGLRAWLQQIKAARNPEHFAVGILGIEPEQRQLRKGGLERRAAAADLAQQPALRRQMPAGLVEDAADDVEPVGAAVEGELRLGAAFARQRRHAFAHRHRADWK